MAERQSVLRYMRQNIAAILVGVTLSGLGAVGVSSLTSTGAVSGASLSVSGNASVGGTLTATGALTASTSLTTPIIAEPGSSGVTIDGLKVKDLSIYDSSGSALAVTMGSALANWTAKNAAYIGGESTQRYAMRPRLLKSFWTFAVSTPPSTAEAVMTTLPLPASTWTGVNGCMRWEAFGSATANANSKIVRLRYGASGSGTGGTVVGACTFAGSETAWHATWFACHDSSSSDNLRFLVECNGAAASDSLAESNGGVSESAVQDWNVTITNATTNTDLGIRCATAEWSEL